MVQTTSALSIFLIATGATAFAPLPSSHSINSRKATSSSPAGTAIRPIQPIAPQLSASPLEVVDETTSASDDAFANYQATEEQTTIAIKDLVIGSGYTVGETSESQLLQVKYSARLLGSKFTAKIREFDIPNMVFPTNQSRILPGLEEGLQGMKVGGKRLVKVPPNKGYGDSWYRGVVAPNSHLEFDVELKNIAQTPGEEFMMKLEQFGVERAVGAAACLAYLAVSPMLEKSGIL
mmetsp:Transcript_28118/g.57329  ORF Transcript_28118/g.57329 Transcript_28118/m.57329 type:complete len:235 (-) Transcript_28118:335-1039(-)